MSNKVYTKEDIYEGVIVKCTYSITEYWTKGKEYIVGNGLTIEDDDGDYWDYVDILDRLNGDNFRTNFEEV